MWFMAAVCSAFFAGVTTILAKLGVRNTDSDLVTALRTAVVLMFAWIMVFIVGSQSSLQNISPHSMLFIVLSGLATGASWICYFKALSLADVRRVMPIDKSSVALTVLFAIVFLGETDHLAVKLLGSAILTAGMILMSLGDEKNGPDALDNKEWLLLALLSAVFAALTSILAKIGITDVESNLAAALRTGVVLIMAWAIVFAKGKQHQIAEIDRREWLFIVLSGIATGASWLCYYHAIQNGPVSMVAPIDKMSILVTAALSYVILHEKMDRRALAGLALMVLGTLIITLG